MYYVYALKSLKDGKYYFGYTYNPQKRLKKHNTGQVLSTKYRRPFNLVGFKEFNTRNEAGWYEYMLKKHGDRKVKFLRELGITKK